MNIEFSTKNYDLSDHLKTITEQKVNKLDKYFSDNDTDCKVSFKKESKSLKTEIMLDYHGNLVRAQAIGDNFYKNLDIVLPKIEGQIRKYRTKFDKDLKNSAFKDTIIYTPEEEVLEMSDKVVKTKRFSLSPITVEEAIEQMELLGHSFFVFCDKSDNTFKVLYQRSDGDLGLIIPQK